ncbi:MAG: low molecular weight phosphatase family protein [Pseudobdellovibrionaceae bacterium]
MSEAGAERGILCVCTENTVRSVMLEAILGQALNVSVASAGLHPAPFCDMMVEAFLKEKDLHVPSHDPQALADTDIHAFGLWIALSRAAYDALRAETVKPELEYWDIPEPLPLGEAPRDLIALRLEEIWAALILHAANRFRITVP